MSLGAHFYTTPATWNELRRLLLGNGVSLGPAQELATWITVKPPDKLSARLPASVFSEYVADVRRRLYRGLRVAEAALRRAVGEAPPGMRGALGTRSGGLGISSGRRRGGGCLTASRT